MDKWFKIGMSELRGNGFKFERIFQVITALGKVWHIEHFTCANCNLPLGTKNFYERDGEAYCEEDYHKIFAPKCAYCNGPIVDVRK